MTVRPRTIQIYLPKGDPRGLRVAELTTSIVRVIEVPRTLLDEFLTIPEAKQVGLYLLVNDDEDQDYPAVYIGQTGGTGQRLVDHHKQKEFWNRALVVVSLTNSLTQTHSLYLEWLGIKLANEAGRYKVENGNASLSGILCARHSMTTRSMYAKQDESEERGDSRQVGRAAEDPQGTA